MLLRRMTEHVRDQNWFAVGLDFVIVVAGVAFAFQLTTWGQERAAQTRAQTSLVQLYEEAEDATAFFVETVRINDEYLELQDRVIAALYNGTTDELDPRMVQSGLYAIGFYRTMSPPRRVYDELGGAGLLREIDAPEALNAVSDYYERLEFIQGQIVFFRPDAVEQFKLFPVPGITNTYDPTSMTRLGIEVDVPALTANPEFMSMVVNTLRNRIVFQSYRRRTLESAAAMCVALAQAVGRVCEAQAEAEALIETPEFLTPNVPQHEEAGE